MRKGIFGSALALSLIADGLCLAQPADPAQKPAQICAKLPCRKGGRAILLGLPDRQGFETRTHPYPYLDDQDAVILYPGEMITIGFNKTDDKWGRPVLMRVTDADGPVNLGTPGPAAATLSFALEQDHGKPGMMLIAANGLPARVKYDVQMFVPSDDGVHAGHSSTCPLMAPQGGLGTFSGFKSWPHLIVMVVITNIRMLPAGAPAACS